MTPADHGEQLVNSYEWATDEVVLQIWSDAAEIATERVRKYPLDIDTQKTIAYIGKGFVDAGEEERALELTTVLHSRYGGWIHDSIREKPS